MKIRKVIPALFFALCVCSAGAQISNTAEKIRQKGVSRLKSIIENKMDAENHGKEDETGNSATGQDGEDPEEENRVSAGKEEGMEENQDPATSQGKKEKLVSKTEYDFVPGDQILYFEDFAQDAIGDFPALWTSNGSGEIKTVNIASGRWFHMNGEDAVYCYAKSIPFPDNFIVEFDIIPDEEYAEGVTLTLYTENPEDPKEINDDLYPGIAGLHILLHKDRWETRGYKSDADSDWLEGKASRNPVKTEVVNHVVVWVQKRRVRIYHEGAKVLDVPTNIHAGTVFEKMRFSGYDAGSWPLISNLKITSATPDTRSKLITEGKLVTYGIYFDVNKAEIRSESYGTLRDIAQVLKDNPEIRVRVAGHTDSDGDDALNLSLSEKRAASVKKELTQTFGIEDSRLETIGVGEQQPLAPNDTPINKAKNRRVEFIKI